GTARNNAFPNFSYGIGKISSEFAELVARKCNIKGDSPSICFSN
ncbi:unnamed protein product, partial [Brassica oleracea var. botrytis]